MTIRQARKLAHYWLQILGLAEWKDKFVVRWGTAEEMEDSVGRNFFMAEELRSEILLAKDQADDDLEHTIVHELLHLIIDGHKSEMVVYDALHERGLNRIAESLIMLDRLGKGL